MVVRYPQVKLLQTFCAVYVDNYLLTGQMGEAKRCRQTRKRWTAIVKA